MGKRILGVVMLCLIIVFSSIAFGQDEAGKQGVILPVGSGYVEKEIGRNSGVKIAGSMKLNSQNQLVVCDLGSKTPRYAVLNSAGKPVGEIKGGFSGDGSVFALDAKDNLYVLEQNKSLDSNKRVTAIDRKLYVYATTASARGKLLKQITLGKAPGENGGPVRDLAVDSKGNIYLLHGSGIAVFDKDGQSKKAPAIDAVNIGFLECDEQDNLVIAGMGMGMAMGKGTGTFLEKLNPLTSQVIWKQNITIGGGFSCGRYSRADHCTYLVDGDGVVQFDPQGRQLGTLLDLKQFSILGFDSVITSINIVKGPRYPTIYLSNLNQQIRAQNMADQPITTDGIPFNIYQYSFTNKLTRPKNQKTITLSTLMPDRFLETAISAFQSKHPEIKIELKTYLNVNLINKIDMEKFVKTVNTELMAGKGPDIITLGFGPFQKLADRNTLVDLNGLIASDKSFDRSKYYTNILDACKYKGGLYALPVVFQFEAFQANQAILDKAGVKIEGEKWNWDDFVKVAEKVAVDSNNDGAPEQFALPNMDRRRLFNWMFRSLFPTFIDLEKKQASIDSVEFIALLNRCKSFSDKQLMNPQADPNAGMVKIVIINGVQQMDKSAISTVAFNPTTVMNYNSILGAKAAFNSARILALPNNGEGGGFETPFGMLLGINRKSKLQKEAWEFLKYLLSEEAQTSQLAIGFPVNKAALRKKAVAELEREKAQGIKNSLDESDLAQVETMITGLRQLNSMIDPQLITIIDDELGPFFSGQKTAEEVAKLIQTKVTTYLQE